MSKWKRITHFKKRKTSQNSSKKAKNATFLKFQLWVCGRKVHKISQNRLTFDKIGQYRQKSAKIGQNRQKSAKIGQNH
jgi:hypothetical protein